MSPDDAATMAERSRPVWKCIIMVPHEYTIEYARDLGTAQIGAENIRAKFPNVVGAVGAPEAGGAEAVTYYPKILEIIGPHDVIDEYAKTVAPKDPEPIQLQLPFGEPPDGPAAA